MPTRSTVLLAALTSAIILAAAAGTGSANRLSFSSTTFRAVWRPLTFSESLFAPARCPVTLEGRFNSATINKTTAAPIGQVTRTAVGACEENAATALTETLPWDLTYQNFSGTLPVIGTIRVYLLGAAFRFRSGISTCTATTEVLHPAQLITEIQREMGGALHLINLRADPSKFIPCAGFEHGKFEGTGTITVENRATLIGISLI